MANASTGWACTHDAWLISQNNTHVTIRVQAYWQNQGWTYNINRVSAWVYCNGQSAQVFSNGNVNAQGSTSQRVTLGYHDFTIAKGTSAFSVSCHASITSNSSYVSGSKASGGNSVGIGAKPSYAITYNANGGTGAPGNQTKWYGDTIRLSGTKPTRAGHDFVRWNTNTANTGTAYAPGASYSANAGLTLYAIWTPHKYTITFNANGGTNPPANQTKTYGVNLTLTSAKPTRTNYNFLGWSKSANGAVDFKSGAAYTANSAATLYAVWELAYLKPRLTNFAAQRCDSAGVASESGTYSKVTFNWATDRAVSAIKIEWKPQSGTTWTNAAVTASGTSGAVSQVVGAGAIGAETTYIIRASVADSGGTTYSTEVTLGTVKYPIDVYPKGDGIGFGKVAEASGIADFGFKPRLQKGIEFVSNGRVTEPIKMIPGDTTGDGVQIGAGGRVVIGSGESADNFLASSPGGNQEDLILTGDHGVYIDTNMQAGYDARKKFGFSKEGDLNMPDGGQVARHGLSTSWRDARTQALIKTTTGPGYSPIMSVKSDNGGEPGTWDLGTYGNNYLYLSYFTDTEYKAGGNAKKADFIFRPDGTFEGRAFQGKARATDAVATYDIPFDRSLDNIPPAQTGSPTGGMRAITVSANHPLYDYWGRGWTVNDGGWDETMFITEIGSNPVKLSFRNRGAGVWGPWRTL